MGKHHEVRASELPICPFCNGPIYYYSWLTHQIFQMECKNCKSHWRTGITKNAERNMYVELVSSKYPMISQEYFEKHLPLQYWIDMIKNK